MRKLVISDDSEFSRKYRYALIFVALIFIILVGRLVQLQLVYGKEYRELSEQNFLSKRLIDSPRGFILDKNNNVLAKNTISFNVFFTPKFFGNKELNALVALLPLTQNNIEYIQQKIVSAEGRKRIYSLLALRDIPKEWVMLLESNREKFRGMDIVTSEKRIYPEGALASHVIGFMGEVSAEDLKKHSDLKYRERDWRGKFGVESMMESELRGKRGYVWRILDSRRRIQHKKKDLKWLPKPWKKDPVPGNNIVLTLDMPLQRKVERIMSKYESGAAVVMETETGKILSYTSKPSFDPNELSGRLSPAKASELYSNPLHPMLDKVVQGTYFPGSTYKVIPASAALEENLISLDEYHLCKGWYEFGKNSSFRCSHAHGLMNIETAITASCNVFFFMLSERVGMDRMARYARLYGFGTPTGLGLNHEKAGFIPTKQWYAQKFQEGFRIGHTLNSAIGQGNVKITVLQLAQAYAAIANRGIMYQPQIIERITTYDGVPIKTFKPVIKRKLPFGINTFDVIIEGLKGVVNSPIGTAYKSRLSGYTVAGKTGTAQVRKMNRDPLKKEKSRWRYQDHAWFVAFSPVDKPEIVVVVLVEHGGFAAKAASPLAMKIIKSYFELKAKRNKLSH